MENEKYAGAEWLDLQMKYGKKWKGPLSDFGRNAANLLGELFFGLYHIRQGYLESVNWAHTAFIELSIDQPMATFDYDNLTRLVFLCHDYGMRGQLTASSPRTMRLMLHPRERTGDISRRHPTLEKAVAGYRKMHPRVKDDADDAGQQ